MAEIKKTAKKTAPVSPDKKTELRAASKKAESNGSFAIIETGGKQYRVSVGDTIKIEKIKKNNSTKDPVEPKEGESVVFDKVLLVDNGKDVTDIGAPYIPGAKVSGTLVEVGRDKKVTVIKYKAKSRYFKKNGHRQPYFKVKIDKIA